MDSGIIHGVAPFAARALTRAKHGSPEALGELCTLFKGEHPCTPQPGGFKPFVLGECWVLSVAGAEEAETVDNSGAFWWINFCGGGERITVTITVDGNPVVVRLSCVTGDPKPRCLLAAPSPPSAHLDVAQLFEQSKRTRHASKTQPYFGKISARLHLSKTRTEIARRMSALRSSAI